MLLGKKFWEWKEGVKIFDRSHQRQNHSRPPKNDGAPDVRQMEIKK